MRFFGKKVIRIADNLFFKGYGPHVMLRQRQVFGSDLRRGQTDADVPLAYQRMPKKPLFFQNLTAKKAMTDIRVFPRASNGRGIREIDAEIVEKRRLPDKRNIRPEMGKAPGYCQRPIRHRPGMDQKGFTEFTSGRVEFADDINRLDAH